MIKKTITYEDFDGNERTEDFYFHLSKAETVEMMVSEAGGLEKHIERIVTTQDNKKIVELFKDLVLTAYGEKSADGRRFVKTKELREEFSQTNAYVEIFMELAEDADAASAFVNGILPKTDGVKTAPLAVKE